MLQAPMLRTSPWPMKAASASNVSAIGVSSSGAWVIYRSMLDSPRRSKLTDSFSLEWALGHNEPEVALRMSAALWMFWYMRGHVSEGRRWLSRALAVAHQSATQARAK